MAGTRPILEQGPAWIIGVDTDMMNFRPYKARSVTTPPLYVVCGIVSSASYTKMRIGTIICLLRMARRPAPELAIQASDQS